MLLAEAQNIRRSPSEAEPGTRFARGVLVAGLAGFAVLTALVPTKRGEAIDRAITARLQAIRRPADRAGDGRRLLVRLPAAEPRVAPHIRGDPLDRALPA